MKLTIPRDQLITGLSRVIDCAHTNVSSPVLCAVLLEAGSGLSLSTTKLDLSANTSIAADVDKHGSIALPAKRLMQVVKELPDGPVFIEAKGERATIKAGPAVFQMGGFDKSAFPARGAVSEKNKVDADAGAIANMLASVAYASYRATGQMTTFCGVSLSIKGGKLSMQATDKKRIAVNSKAVDAAHEVSCIIPNGSVAVFRRLLADAISVSLAFDDTGIYLSLTHEGGTTNVQSAVISSQYPNVQAVVDKQLDAQFVEIPVAKDAFTTLLRRISVATDELTPFCRFHFEPKKLTVYAVTKSFGKGEETMDITYEGPVVDIGLKPKDLLEPIDALDGEVVKLSICSGVKPAVIRGDDAGFLCLIAPVPLS